MERKKDEMRIIRLKELMLMTGLSRATVFNKMNDTHSQFDDAFPRSIKLGKSSTGWLQHELIEWIESLSEQRFK